MDFEKNLKDLEAIAEKMSAGQMGLTESIAAFKKGMEIVRRCQKELGGAEQVVEKLVRIQAGGQPETEPFESAEAAAAKPNAESRQANKPKISAEAGKSETEKTPAKNGGGGRHSNGGAKKASGGSKKTNSQKDLF